MMIKKVSWWDFVNLTQVRVIWVERTSVEKNKQTNKQKNSTFQTGYRQACEDVPILTIDSGEPFTWGQYRLLAGDPEMYKKAGVERHEELKS